MRALAFSAMALAVCSSVNAAPMTTTQSITLASTSVTANDTTAGTSWVNALSNQDVSFTRFNASTGVLTGVSSQLSYTGGSVTLSSAGTKSGTSGTVRFLSQGSILATSTIASEYLLFGQINETLGNSCSTEATCFPSGVSNLSANGSMTKTDSTWLSPTATVSAASLNNYVGSGTVATTLTTQNSVLLQSQSRISGGRATQSIVNLTGSQSLTYGYLGHANASFSAAGDINTLTQAGGFGFSVFNLGDASTTKLDFVSLQCVSGNCDAFNITLPSFQDLAAGSSVAGNVALTTTLGGAYAATYSLVFSDDTAVGATSTHLQNALTLTVAAVPEPGSWALLGLGLVGLAFRRLKQQ
jgi:hypothetical protein